jgi:signal transduction histidine kinase
MNPLLKQQIEDNLNKECNNINSFLKVIDDSYSNFEQQIALLQQTMKISSEALHNANTKLREEADDLKKINQNLEKMIHSLSNKYPETVYNDTKNTTKFIKIQPDEFLTINKEREDLYKNIEQQNLKLNEYAQLVSHDLKAPLRNIDTLINWFKNDNTVVLHEANLKSLDLILTNVEKMELLIADVLQYSKVDKVTDDDKNIDLEIVIYEVMKSIQLPTNIELKINNKLPIVTGNEFRLQLLFQHLIKNAVQYNDKKLGLIEIGTIKTENNTIFYIKDNGIGIDKKYQNKIFELFSKLENNNSGSGIGLSIVNKIINLNDGKIWLESELGKGSTFYFTLKIHNEET